jgi:hypothetical protein
MDIASGKVHKRGFAYESREVNLDIIIEFIKIFISINR